MAAVPEPAAPDPSSVRDWDGAGADKVLADVNARIDGALANGEASTPVRRAVLEDYRAVVVGLHARRDVSLWQALDGIELLLRRWRERDASPQPTPTPTLTLTLVPVVSRSARRRKGTDA